MSDEASTNLGGRPTKYDPAYCEQAEKLAKLGATDKEIADFFEVSEQTLNAWKHAHPEFLESLKKGKEIADAEVASKLFHRATGYEHEEVHVSNYQGEITLTPLVKHYPPDTTAAIFWLKNRQRTKWRDKQDHEHTGKDGESLKQEINEVELARRIAFFLAQQAQNLEKPS